jgi:hypothetical protein
MNQFNIFKNMGEPMIFEMMGEDQKGLFREKRARVGLMALGMIALGLLLVWGRAFYGSWKAFEEGETFLKEGEHIRAISYFDRSIHWYTPFNPYVSRSAERLWEIGEQAEEEGDIKLALIAFRTIRGGFYAARSLYTPGKDWIQKSDEKIELLVRAEMIAAGNTELPSLRKQEVLGPKPFWSLLVVTSFLGWVSSIICIIFFSFRNLPRSSLLSSPVIKWGGLALVFFVLWLIGMMKA